MQKLIKHIIESARKHRLKKDEMFNILIEMTYQLNCTNTFDIQYKYLEKEHLIFRDMLANLVTENPFTDVLGEVMMDVFNFDKKYLGQCMTPNDISSLTAKITNEFHLKNLNHKEEINVADNCGCGSGSLLLSSLKNALESNAKTINVFANDINEEMVKVCIVQLQYNRVNYYINNRQNHKNINIIAYCGNGLLNYAIPENIRCHPELRRIADPYIKGYFDYLDYQESLNPFNSISDRFNQKLTKNKQVA